MRRRGGAGLALAALAAGALPAAPADEARTAAAAAQRTLASIEGRPCPAFGDRAYIGGGDPAALTTAADRELAFARTSMGTLGQLARDPEVSSRTRPELMTLGSWTVAASLANWAALAIGLEALAVPAVRPGQPHPAEALDRAEAALAPFARDSLLAPDAHALLGRLQAALARCATAARGAVIAANEAAIRDAIRGAQSSAELQRVDDLYRLRRNAGSGGAALVAAWDERRSAILAREAAVRPKAPAAPAYQAPAGPSEAQLATARRFVAAASRQDEAAALAELAADVELVTPQSSYSGKAAVARAVRQQAAEGGSGGLSPPVISGGRVVAAGRVRAFSVLTSFDFDSANKINRMVVRLN